MHGINTSRCPYTTYAGTSVSWHMGWYEEVLSVAIHGRIFHTIILLIDFLSRKINTVGRKFFYRLSCNQTFCTEYFPLNESVLLKIKQGLNLYLFDNS